MYGNEGTLKRGAALLSMCYEDDNTCGHQFISTNTV